MKNVGKRALNRFNSDFGIIRTGNSFAAILNRKIDHLGSMNKFLEWMRDVNGIEINIRTAQKWAQAKAEPCALLQKVILEKIQS